MCKKYVFVKGILICHTKKNVLI